jgi:hypothetical protein
VNISKDQTLAVYAVGPEGDGPRAIYVYNIATKTTTPITTKSTRWESAFFDSNGQILFIDSSDGSIKRMDSSGSNVTLLTTPSFPYTFNYFWLSPDRNTIAAIEETHDADYYTTNYDNVVVIDANTGVRISTNSQLLGEWNAIFWKPDSSRFLYYHHIFNVSGGVYQGKTPQYTVYSNLTSASPTAIDLSGSYMGQKEENICLYTKSGNLLSLSYQELYNGQTGTLIGARPDVPAMDSMMVGSDGAGDLYFADLNKANFRRFIELGASSCGTPVQVGASPYTMIIDAYNSTATSSGDIVQMQASDFIENLNLQRNIATHLQGGFNCTYSSQTGFSTIHGDLMISNGTVTIDNVAIQ